MRTDQFATDSKIQQGDDPNFFPFAFASGTFEVLDQNGFLISLTVHNPSRNPTINVRAYCDYEHRWVFKSADRFYCYRHIGFVGSHSLFVFGFGGVEAWP
jgi:hypothetical protein